MDNVVNYKYQPNEYLALLMQTRNKYLLVEGPTDKDLFTIFLREFVPDRSPIAPEKQSRIVVEVAADHVRPEDAIGNRAIVEEICKRVQGLSFADQVVGFVDREFREFDHSSFTDRLSGHRVLDRLVWSRGHSVENYLFDFQAVRAPFRGCSFGVNADFEAAIDIFETVFESSIRLACAASLAAQETTTFALVEGAAHWSGLTISNSKVQPNMAEWRAYLESVHAPLDTIDAFLDRLQFWLEKVQSADFAVVRWMCHGHIGMAFLWAVYTRCIYEACHASGKPKVECVKITRKVAQTAENLRFGNMVTNWTQRALGNQGDFPMEVLRLLGLPVPAP